MTSSKDLSPSAAGMTNEIEEVDRLPKPLRDCVHEFGWSVVRAFLDHGIRKPATIRYLVHTVWLGSREPGNRPVGRQEGAYRTLNALDEFLVRSAPIPSARALVGLLRQQSCVIVPREPSPESVAAAGCTVEQLRRFLRSAERGMWPFLHGGSEGEGQR